MIAPLVGSMRVPVPKQSGQMSSPADVRVFILMTFVSELSDDIPE
jgi:hypothetical protein